jgi:hypothetical protein
MPSNIVNAKFIVRTRVIKASVPEDPDNFGKFIPDLTICIHFANLQLALYEGLAPIPDYKFG